MSFRIDWLEGSRIAVFSLKANRLRTLLTTIGVGIGVATLLAIAGIIRGLNTKVENDLKSVGASNVYIAKYPWGGGHKWWKYRNRKDFTVDQFLALRGVPHVEAVAPTCTKFSRLAFLDQQQPSVDVDGSNADYALVFGYEIAKGRMFNQMDNLNHRDVVVLGSDTREALFGGINPVGQQIRIGSVPFTVVGTFKRLGSGMGNPDEVAVIPMQTFISIYGRKHRFSGAVRVDSAKNLDATIDGIRGTLRRLRHTPPGAPDDFAINQADSIRKVYQKLTGALFAVAIAVGLITLLVGGIGIMNIMLVSVRERTREIGLRRALGAHKRTIIVQFLLEAISVSAVGGGLGAAVGWLLARAVAFTGKLPASLSAPYIIGAIIFAALMGLIFGIWPAARAASLDPVEALRYE